MHLPPTVQGVLAARIDRLAPDEKALLQQLAVIGREFPVSLIRQVITQPEDELYRLLASLQRKEFLYEQPAFPEVEYIFKHALTQEVAYGTVLQEQRKAVTRAHRPGDWKPCTPRRCHEHYSDLAHHYRRSANTEKAIDVSPSGGATGGATLGQQRGDQPFHRGPGLAPDAARYTGASPAGTHPTLSRRTGADGRSAGVAPASGTALYARPGVV